jgi:hypothetical protein
MFKAISFESVVETFLSQKEKRKEKKRKERKRAVKYLKFSVMNQKSKLKN